MVHPGNTYKGEIDMFRRNITTTWDKLLPPLIGLTVIGVVAYYFQLAILMLLFLGFLAAMLASAFGR